MATIDVRTGERIEAVPNGVRRTSTVIITINGIPFHTEVPNLETGMRLAVEVARELGVAFDGAAR